MKKASFLFCALVFCLWGRTSAETYTVYDAWWDGLNDTDCDGYFIPYALIVDVNVDNPNTFTVVISIRIYNKDGTLTYYADQTTNITGNNTGDARWFFVTDKFPHNSYFTYIIVTKEGISVATRGPGEDPDLNNQKFETSAEGTDHPLPKIDVLTWSDEMDPDHDGYVMQKTLRVTSTVEGPMPCPDYGSRLQIEWTQNGSWVSRYLYRNIYGIPYTPTNPTITYSISIGPKPPEYLTNDYFKFGEYDFRITSWMTLGTSASYGKWLDGSTIPDLDKQKYETEQQNQSTIECTNIEWASSPNFMDQDADGYRSKDILYLSTGSWSECHYKVYYKLASQSSYTFYANTKSHILDPDATISLSVGSPGIELPHGLYDFKLELYNTNTDYLVHTYDEKTNPLLNDQKFENTGEDGAANLPATIFKVTVPGNTPVSDLIYLAGDFNYWDSGPGGTGSDGAQHDLPMTKTGTNQWQISLQNLAGKNILYKYTRGNWASVEKGASGEEISNRTASIPASGDYTLNDTVLNWADIQAPASVWKSQSSGTSQRLNWVKAVSDQIAWIAGNNGTILRTINGGNNWWNAAVNLPVVNYWCIDAMDDLRAIVPVYTQDPVSTVYTASIYKTIDGGSNWVKKYEKNDVFINTVKMFDSMNGIALADPVQGKWLVLSTSDGGETWTPQSNAPVQKEGELGNFGSCWQSIDKGWFGTDKPRAYALSGSSWTELPVALLDHVNTLSFDESGNGMAGDTNTGKMVRTRNWGQNWEAMTPSETAFSWIAYFNQRFWLTATKNLYSSTDLGTTWNLEATAADNLRHMSFTTAASGLYGWAVGRSGTILYYVPRSVPVEEKKQESLPEGLVLHQNYPNPFNAETQILYELPYHCRIKLAIYDLLGHELRELINDNQTPGLHEASFNAGQLPSGIYFYKLTAVEADGRSYQLTKKLMLMK